MGTAVVWVFAHWEELFAIVAASLGVAAMVAKLAGAGKALRVIAAIKRALGIKPKISGGEK